MPASDSGTTPTTAAAAGALPPIESPRTRKRIDSQPAEAAARSPVSKDAGDPLPPVGMPLQKAPLTPSRSAQLANGTGASHRPDPAKELAKVSCHAAAMVGDLENLQRLVNSQTREDKDKSGFTPLHFAACYGREGVVEWLVGQGSDVEAKNELEWTALHVASRNGHIQCVTILIEAGADVNSIDVHKSTPLHNACCSSSLETVDKLLAAGARTDARDKDGWTPLHFAARFNNVEMLDSLLAAGADLNVQDVDGWTAIHNSARNGRNRCVTKLLEKGASILIKTRWEETPLHVACRKGKAKIVAEMVSFAKQQKTGGAPGDLYKSLLSAKDSEGRTPEDLSSSEHIRGILRGEGIESGYEITTSSMGMMTLPRGSTLTNFGGSNNGQAISESLRKGTGMSRTCTIL